MGYTRVIIIMFCHFTTSINSTKLKNFINSAEVWNVEIIALLKW